MQDDHETVGTIDLELDGLRERGQRDQLEAVAGPALLDGSMQVARGCLRGAAAQAKPVECFAPCAHAIDFGIRLGGETQ
jgi:hypothetical protein